VCPVMTAEPRLAPGWAPADHQPTVRGLDGGVSDPLLALILSTGAETPSRGTEIRCGRADRATGLLVVPLAVGGLLVPGGDGGLVAPVADGVVAGDRFSAAGG
jgi:hypothetical protein